MKQNKDILISADDLFKPTRVSIKVPMQGHNPIFGFIYIDEIPYQIYKRARTFVIRKCK